MLSISDLACVRGGVPVLQGVSFDLSAGEVLMLRGPNGSGKTTLLRTIAGLQPALHGQIEASEDIAYGAHSDGLKSTLSVAENLDFRAGIFGTKDIAAALQAYEAARRAIIRCGTNGFDLPQESYDRWRQIELVFNPEGMRLR